MNAWMQVVLPWVDALGRSLLHFLWQGALIGLAYWLLRPLCASVRARYRLGMGALLLMLACPLATLALLRPVADALGNASASAVPIPDGVIAATALLVSTAQWEQALPWFVALWLAGVCLIATRSFLHWRRLARAVRAATLLPRDWQLRLIQLRQRFGILRPVRLLTSIEIGTPTLIGWLKPAIVLPASLLTGFTPAQIELIIAHELSHVRRFDYLANLAQVAIETLLFYHPAVYWISREVRQAREQCCDDLVLTLGGGNAVAYARTLADLEELQHDFGPTVPALGAGGGVLFARIRRIVDPRHALALEPLPRSNGLTLPMLLAFAGVALAALRLHLLPPAAVAEAVMQAPRESMAVISGNVRLSAPRAAAPAAAEPSTAPVPVPAGERTTTSSSGYLVDSLARPQIRIANLQLGVVRVAKPGVLELAPLPLAAVAETESPTAMAGASTEAARAVTPDATRVPLGLPKIETMVQPQYPAQALAAGVTGRVDLDFRIAADGSVHDIRVRHAQPAGVFEQVAILALKQWRFATGETDGASRYARSFAFTHAAPPEICREVTGSHICRQSTPETDAN
ncbi:MAG TPA: TonB family protein [Rudaea sp.]|jgi:TonB family protein|uniref:M56 family metallopeptidase n=1 Tax=Rudaea sp. TaxID=2136325 RepID=UPI002F95EDBA